MVYIFSGTIIMGSVYYALEGNILCAICSVTRNFLGFIVYLFISYFLGVISNQAVNLIPFLRKGKYVKLRLGGAEFLIIVAKIRKYWGISAVRGFERRIYFRNLGSAVGSSSLLGSFVFLVFLILDFHYIKLITFLILLFITAICFIEKDSREKEIDKDLDYFSDMIALEEKGLS